jgi:hypothetical protein
MKSRGGGINSNDCFNKKLQCEVRMLPQRCMVGGVSETSTASDEQSSSQTNDATSSTKPASRHQ